MPAVLERVSKTRARKLDRILRPFEQGGRYVTHNSDKLLDQYGEGWIALKGTKVVAHSPTRRGLRLRLARQHLAPNHVYSTYLTRERRTLIL